MPRLNSIHQLVLTWKASKNETEASNYHIASANCSRTYYYVLFVLKSPTSQEEHNNNGSKDHDSVGEVKKLHLSSEITQDKCFYEGNREEAKY